MNSLTHKKEKAKDRLISVILPTYNNGDMISECIDSVLCQTYENFEIIIVNDGSTDDSESVLGKAFVCAKGRKMQNGRLGHQKGQMRSSATLL